MFSLKLVYFLILIFVNNNLLSSVTDYASGFSQAVATELDFKHTKNISNAPIQPLQPFEAHSYSKKRYKKSKFTMMYAAVGIGLTVASIASWFVPKNYIDNSLSSHVPRESLLFNAGRLVWKGAYHIAWPAIIYCGYHLIKRDTSPSNIVRSVMGKTAEYESLENAAHTLDQSKVQAIREFNALRSMTQNTIAKINKKRSLRKEEYARLNSSIGSTQRAMDEVQASIGALQTYIEEMTNKINKVEAEKSGCVQRLQTLGIKFVRIRY